MKLNTKNLNRRGTTTTEYLIILAILAIGSIMSTGILGQRYKHAMARVGEGLDGGSLGPDAGLSTAAKTEAKELRRMGNFDGTQGQAAPPAQ